MNARMIVDRLIKIHGIPKEFVDCISDLLHAAESGSEIIEECPECQGLAIRDPDQKKAIYDRDRYSRRDYMVSDDFFDALEEWGVKKIREINETIDPELSDNDIYYKIKNLNNYRRAM